MKFCVKDRLYKSVEGVYDGDEKSIKVFTCRNTLAAFQIVLHHDSPFAVCVGDTPFLPQKTAKDVVRVNADGLDIRLEKYQTVEGGARYADAITDDFYGEFFSTAALFISVFIPKNSKKSLKGSIDLFCRRGLADETKLGSVEYEIEVSDFVMPDARDFKLHLDLWQHPTSVARAHGVKLFGEKHFELLEDYISKLAFLGQKCISLVVTDMPWGGQSCDMHLGNRANLFEYSIVKIKKTADGFEYDFSAMQRYIDLCMKHGIEAEIELFGLVGVWNNGEKLFDTVTEGRPDRLRVRYTDLSGAEKYMHSASDIDDYVRALEAYFIKKGLIDRVRVCADEPADIDAYRQSITHLRSIAPNFKFKSAINHAEFISEFENEISDFVPYIDCLAREYGEICEKRKNLPGKRFLWYVCCGPNHPNTFIRSPLCEALFIGAFTSFSSMDGFLRWSYCLFTDDPMREQNYHIFPAGDLGLVYPSKHGGALPTLRYYALRQGVELFELLEQAKERGIDTKPFYDAIIFEQDVSKYRYGALNEKSFMQSDSAKLQSALRMIYLRLAQI